MKLFTPLFKTFLLVSFLPLLNACSSETAKKQQDDDKAPPTVTVATVLHEEIIEWDEYTGRLSAPQSVELRARVSGYIEQVHLKEGKMVKQGDLLFTIDPATFKAQTARDQAQLSAAKSSETNARSEFERAERLISSKAIAQELFDTRKAQLASASAQLKTAQANLKLSQLNLDHTQVRAPISGRVSNAMLTKGNFITAGQNMLTTIVSTDKIYAYFDADERAYLKYSKLARNGRRPSSRETPNPVLMGLANDNDYPYKGFINFVDNQINPLTSTIRGRAVFENKDGNLIPGLFSRIRVPGSAHYNAILVNDTSVGTDLGTKFVLVIDKDNIAKRRTVILGDKFAGLRIIKSGLEKGETIVTNGLQRIRSDTKVKPIKKAMANRAVLQKIQQLQAQTPKTLSFPALVNEVKPLNVTGG